MRPTPPAWLDNWKAWPRLTLGLGALWIVAYLFVEVGHGGALRISRDAHYEAARLTAREPRIQVSAAQLPVVRAIHPNFESDSLLDFMGERSEDESVRVLQASFDQAAHVARWGLEAHPFRTLGMVAADPAPYTFLSHALLHAGTLHLLATLLLWLLLAPAVERMWGPVIFGTSCLLVALAGAGVYGLVHGGSERPLIGPGAVIAALAAALAVRRTREAVDFTGWLGEQLRFGVTAPGFVAALAWALYEGALLVVAQGVLPPGADNVIGLTAHATGAVLGAGLALLIARLGLEREEAPAPQARKPVRFDLARVEKMAKQGEADEAFDQLGEEAARSAGNRDLVIAYWNMAIERGVAAEAAPALVRLIEEELRRGAESVAAAHWKLLHQGAPRVLLDATKLIRIARAINREHGEDAVGVALEQALDEENTGLTPAHAATVARMAFELDPRLAARAARRALASGQLDEKVRSEMEMLDAALRPGSSARGVAKKKEAPPPSAFFEESDRSAFGEANDLSALASEGFPDGATSEAIATSATGRSLGIEIEGRGASKVDWSRMRAVAIVGVHGLADKPVVLIDILVDGCDTAQPLGLIRLRCDRFDPRILVPGAGSVKEALRTMAAGFRKQGIAVLADLSSPSEPSRPVFDSLEAYHDKVLRPAACDYA